MILDMTSKHIKKDNPFGGAHVTLLVWKLQRISLWWIMDWGSTRCLQTLSAGALSLARGPSLQSRDGTSSERLPKWNQAGKFMEGVSRDKITAEHIPPSQMPRKFDQKVIKGKKRFKY